MLVQRCTHYYRGARTIRRDNQDSKLTPPVPFSAWVHLNHDDVYINGPFHFAVLNGRQTKDRYRWRTLTSHTMWWILTLGLARSIAKDRRGRRPNLAIDRSWTRVELLLLLSLSKKSELIYCVFLYCVDAESESWLRSVKVDSYMRKIGKYSATPFGSSLLDLLYIEIPKLVQWQEAERGKRRASWFRKLG